MDDPHWSVQDAKNRFSEVVEAAREQPQTVTKHGKRAVVMVAAEEYDRLKKLEKRNAPSFKEHLLTCRKTTASLSVSKAGFGKAAFSVPARYRCFVRDAQAQMRHGRYKVGSRDRGGRSLPECRDHCRNRERN